MRSQLRLLLLVVSIVVLVLSACKADGDLSGEEIDDLSESEIQKEIAAEGQGTAYYRYKMNTKDLEYDIQSQLGLSFDEAEGGQWSVNVTGQTDTTLRMTAEGGESGSCQLKCNMTLLVIGQGPVLLKEDLTCEIPVNFRFEVFADSTIIESDCPDEFLATIDCTALSMVMFDPLVYTFYRGHWHEKLQDNNVVTQEAKLFIEDIPEGIGNSCGW